MPCGGKTKNKQTKNTNRDQHTGHLEVPRLGVESELQLPAYTTATATLEPRHICDLRGSLWQCQILNPLSEARDRALILMDTSQVLNPLTHSGNSCETLFFNRSALSCIRHCLSLSFFLIFHLWYMEFPRLGVELELQLPAYTTATATPDLSHICKLHLSLWQCQILNPLSEARDQTQILMDTSQVLNLLSHNRNSPSDISKSWEEIKGKKKLLF